MFREDGGTSFQIVPDFLQTTAGYVLDRGFGDRVAANGDEDWGVPGPDAETAQDGDAAAAKPEQMKNCVLKPKADEDDEW